MFRTTVKIIDNSNQVIAKYEEITVRLVERLGWYEIQVIWEDGGLSIEDFREKGLFGFYSSGYNIIDFIESSEQLKVYSSTGMNVLIDAN